MTRSQLLSIAGIATGGVLSLSPMIGLLGTVVGMTATFAKLGSDGVSRPQQPSESIGHVLMSAAAGILIFPVGILILVLSIFFLVKTSRRMPPPISNTTVSSPPVT